MKPIRCVPENKKPVLCEKGQVKKSCGATFFDSIEESTRENAITFPATNAGSRSRY